MPSYGFLRLACLARAIRMDRLPEERPRFSYFRIPALPHQRTAPSGGSCELSHGRHEELGFERLDDQPFAPSALAFCIRPGCPSVVSMTTGSDACATTSSSSMPRNGTKRAASRYEEAVVVASGRPDSLERPHELAGAPFDHVDLPLTDTRGVQQLVAAERIAYVVGAALTPFSTEFPA